MASKKGGPVRRRSGRTSEKAVLDLTLLKETTVGGGPMRTRCQPTFFRDTMETILDKASARHQEAVNRTPFASFLQINPCQIPGGLLVGLMKRLSPDGRTFRFGVNTMVPFSFHEFSALMGLRASGEWIDLSFKAVDKIPFLERCFPKDERDGSRLGRDNVIEKMKELKTRHDSVSLEDFSRMYILLVCICILFPTSNYSFPNFLFPYVEALDEVDNYAWGQAVHQFLVRSILQRPKYIEGCTIGLLVWVYEHVPSFGKRRSNNSIPRFTRWIDPSKRPTEQKVQELMDSLTADQIPHPLALRPEEYRSFIDLPHNLVTAESEYRVETTVHELKQVNEDELLLGADEDAGMNVAEENFQKQIEVGVEEGAEKNAEKENVEENVDMDLNSSGRNDAIDVEAVRMQDISESVYVGTIDKEYAGKQSLSEEERVIIDRFIEKADYQNSVVWSSHACTLTGKHLVELMLGKALISDVIDAWFKYLASPFYQARYHPPAEAFFFSTTAVQNIIGVMTNKDARFNLSTEIGFSTFLHALQSSTTKETSNLREGVLQSCKYIVMPIHGDYHWHLLALDVASKSFFHYNSMTGARSNGRARTCASAIRNYIRHFKIGDVPGDKVVSPKCRQQSPHGVDCGVWLCMFGEALIRNDDLFWDEVNKTRDVVDFRARIVAGLLYFAEKSSEEPLTDDRTKTVGSDEKAVAEETFAEAEEKSVGSDEKDVAEETLADDVMGGDDKAVAENSVEDQREDVQTEEDEKVGQLSEGSKTVAGAGPTSVDDAVVGDIVDGILRTLRGNIMTVDQEYLQYVSATNAASDTNASSIAQNVRERADMNRKRDEDFVTPPGTSTPPKKKPKRLRVFSRFDKCLQERVPYEGSYEETRVINKEFGGRLSLSAAERVLVDRFIDQGDFVSLIYGDGSVNLKGFHLAELLIGHSITSDVVDVWFKYLSSASYKDRYNPGATAYFVPTHVSQDIDAVMRMKNCPKLGTDKGYEAFTASLPMKTRAEIAKLRLDLLPEAKYVVFPLLEGLVWNMLVLDCTNHSFVVYNTRPNSPSNAYVYRCASTIRNYMLHLKLSNVPRSNVERAACRQAPKDSFESGTLVCMFGEALIRDEAVFSDEVNRTGDIKNFRARIFAGILEFAWKPGA